MLNKLLLKNFPHEFTKSDKEQFLKLFDAQDVVAMSDYGRMKNCCYASFEDEFSARQALEALHQLDVMGHKIVAEYAKPAHVKSANHIESRSLLEKVSQDGKEKSDVFSKDSDQTEEHTLAICSKLNVNHEFPRHLKYNYPAPSVMILTNIANALATVPRFYEQVLHLMNKMCLPPPFTGPTPSPPVKGDSIFCQDACVDTFDLNSFDSSDESEMENDTDEGKKSSIYQSNELINGPVRKRRRLKVMPKADQDRLKSVVKHKPRERIENTFQLASTSKRMTFKLAASIQEVVQGKKNPKVSYNVFDERGEFGKIPPVSNKNVESDETDEESGDNTNDYVSLARLSENRISSDEISAMAQFKNYVVGEKTNRLYVKNLSKQVQMNDLQYIYKRFVRRCNEEEQAMFDIKLMQEGRMKGQAFVTFPSEKLAARSLRLTHGYVLHSKPMVVQFARVPKSKEP